MNQLELFPEITPYREFRLKVSDLHEIHIEEVGNPKGKPVVFLHGGPGGGIHSDYRRYFDPQFYRVILFDQRGAGRSTPYAELKENTTWDLVDDIEKIKKHLEIKKWIVFGGSWGSTLALCYSLTYPESVAALALRGIFLCREKEIHWFYQEGANKIFPDAWEGFLSPIPEAERGNLISAYYKRLTSNDSSLALSAARAWSVWEAATSKLYPDKNLIDIFGQDNFALAFARIECHYFVNKIFVDSDNFIFDRLEKIKHIPCEIVQGRYDIVCPTESAWELHKALPNSQLHIIPDSGHSLSETGITKKLLEVMEKFKDIHY